MSQRRISSSITLFVAIMLPIIWCSFFGSLLIVILFKGGEVSPIFHNWTGKLIYFICFAAFLFFIYRTLMRLKRVEVDGEFVYVYNYVKSVRYPYHNVDRIVDIDLGVIKLGKVVLIQAGRFGKKMYFLRSKKNIATAKEEFAMFNEKATDLHS